MGQWVKEKKVVECLKEEKRLFSVFLGISHSVPPWGSLAAHLNDGLALYVRSYAAPVTTVYGQRHEESLLLLDRPNLGLLPLRSPSCKPLLHGSWFGG